MSTQVKQESKFSYRFTVEARGSGPTVEEPSKAEIQAYINEILGVTREKKEQRG